MNQKKLSIIGDNGEVKEILAFSERVRIFYERFPRERYSVIMEIVPPGETNPFLQAVEMLRESPESLKEVMKLAPKGCFEKSAHYRCSLRDDFTKRIVGAADAFGEMNAYKDLERIQSAAFSRMLAIVCDINPDDLDGDIENDIETMKQSGTFKSNTGSIKSATPVAHQSTKEAPATVATFPRRGNNAQHKDDAFEQSASDQATTPAAKNEAPEEKDDAKIKGFFFLLEQEDANTAAEIATDCGINPSDFANYLGSDKVRLRRILKQYHRVAAGSLSKEDFVAMVNEKIGE